MDQREPAGISARWVEMRDWKKGGEIMKIDPLLAFIAGAFVGSVMQTAVIWHWGW
jgi:hypothetical protein